MKRVSFKTLLVLGFGVMLLATVSCNRKSDSWTSRFYHTNTARFNPYFNGEQAFLAGSASAKKVHKDDYDEILSVYKWSTAESAKSIASEMDRTIEKCTKVIQEHSMVIKNKQKNIYVVKSYLLIGKARFYQYDFFPALETFNYIIQQFSKDKKAKDLVAEAQLWAGRCQIMIGNPSSAQAYFDELYFDKHLSKKYKAEIAASMAQLYIDKKEYEEAVLKLNEAVKNKPPKEQRIRWKFIEAQLHERLGNNYEATNAYKEVIRLKPVNYDMMFNAQLNRAKNFDVYLENANIVYRELNKMLDDEKNTEYRDQIYYVMGEVALAEEEYVKADDFLKKSVRSSVNNNVQKGRSYLKIADINFEFKEYVLAQNYYDSASTTLPQDHKQHKFAQKRAESLKGLVENIKIITLEDSLQMLAKLSPEKQLKKFQDYVEWLKDEEERLQREKEIRELNEQLIADSRNMAGNQVPGSAGGWYFYNENTRASGISKFKSKWGNRKQEDNWRRKNKNTVSFDQGDETANTDLDVENTAKKGGKYDPEFYLVNIPNTPEMLDSSNARIMRAYVALGDIYKEELQDFDESLKSYKNELTRYPASKLEPRVLFSIYRVYIGIEKTKEAEPYKQQLLSNYPSSIYAQLIKNEGKLDKSDENYKAVSAFYQERYAEYKAKNYKIAVKNFDKNKELYEGTLLQPKCDLLEAMCYGKLRQEEKFIAALKTVIAKHPNTPEAISAQNTLNLTDAEQPEQANAGDSSAVVGKGNFTYNANDPHMFVVIMPNKGLDLNTVKNAVSDFNQTTFKLERLQMQNIFFDKDHQMIVVSGLKNAAKARVYYKQFTSNATIMGYLPAKVTTKIIISSKNYGDLYKDKNLEEYLNFQEEKYQIEKPL